MLFQFFSIGMLKFFQKLLVFSENECYSIFVGLFLSRNIQKGLCMIVYRKRYDKTCKTLRPIKSAMGWVIYLQNKTLIQIKKRNYNILLNYMFFISLYLTLPSYISSSRVCSSRINILFLFLGWGVPPIFHYFSFSAAFLITDNW